MKTRPPRNVLSLFMAFLLCAPAAFLVLPAESSDKQPTSQTAGELLQQAIHLTDIWSGDAPSFRLTARVEVYEKGKKDEGTYTLLWNSPTIWREEIAFSGYSQVRLARINKLLISRNPSTPSEQIYRVGKLMDFSSFLRPGIRDQLYKLQEKEKSGSREKWIEIAMGRDPWKKIFFDESSAVPTRIEYKGAALGMRYPYKEFDLKFQFGDYAEFHGLQFPRTLQRFESSQLKVRVQVQEWVEATFGESDFAPPDDSHWIRWCPNGDPPRLHSPLMMTNASFPPQLRTGGPPSRVVIGGIVGTDGLWHNLEAVKSAGSMVDSFWMSQMRRQHFEPAQCGDTPVEYEMMIEFDWP